MRVFVSAVVGIIRVRLIGVVAILRDVLITSNIVELSVIDIEMVGALEEWHIGVAWRWQWWLEEGRRAVEEKHVVLDAGINADTTCDVVE